jgi:hypothetical protein
MKHDDGLACYALETLAEKFKAANQLPSAITFWSDGIMSLTYSQLCCRCIAGIAGAPNQFKFTGRFGSYGSFRIDSNLTFLCVVSFFSLAMVKGHR